MLGLVAVAAQLAIIAHAPDTVGTCDAIEVSVAISSGGGAPGAGAAGAAIVPQLIVPTFAPFVLLRGTTSPYLESSFGSLVAEYRFTITTERGGRFTIPPFEARLGDARALSRPLSITVSAARGRSSPAVIARARFETGDGPIPGLPAEVDTVFVGQQATYEVAVLLNHAARDRLRRNPTFYPPEMQAMLAYDLVAPAPGEKQAGAGSQCFDALVYRRALFPLVAARLVIPPAQLVYNMGLSSSSLFSREESHEITTDSVTIVSIDPPLTDRPADYTGAVGNFAVEANVDSSMLRVGDPTLLTVSVTGKGNVKLFPRPHVTAPWAALVAADERVRIDSNNARIGGVKEFDWVLTPSIAGEFDLPPVQYGYFDPARRQYDVAAAVAKRVRIAPGTLASGDTAHAETVLSIRTRYGGPSWPPLQSRPTFWLVMALAPMPALVARLRRRARRLRTPTPYDPQRALAAASPDDSGAIRRHFVRALAQRLQCHPQEFTHPGALQRALLRAGVSEATALHAESLLRSLDSAAYAGTGAPHRTSPREAAAVLRAIHAEALARTELPFWVPVVLLGAAVSLVATATASDTAATSFGRGVSAYVRRDYATARGAFADAASVSPTSADVWANYGTASWSVADTSAAVFGWRQALALEPAARDLQQRATLVGDLVPTAPGWVPPVPRGTTVLFFALLWIATWAFAWMDWAGGKATRNRAWVARVPLPLAICAFIVGILSIEVESHIAGDRLAVVRHRASLTSDPALGMDRGPTVITGEIVMVAGRRGTWTRVEATDDRDGWIPSSQLLSIADRRPPRD